MNRNTLRIMLGTGKHLEIGGSLMVWVELDYNGAQVRTRNTMEDINSFPSTTIQEAIEEAIDLIIKQANSDLYKVMRRAHELGYEQEDLIHLVKSVDVEEIMES